MMSPAQVPAQEAGRNSSSMVQPVAALEMHCPHCTKDILQQHRSARGDTLLTE